MTLIDKLYNSCVLMSQKATKGMKSILQRNLTPKPNPTGIISQLDIDVTKNDSIITIQTHFPNYAYFVEYGRRAGEKPPIEPIRDWCNLHNLPQGMEWYVQKVIGERGTKGKHFLLPLQRMLEMIEKTMTVVTRDYLVANYNYKVYFNANVPNELNTTI